MKVDRYKTHWYKTIQFKREIQFVYYHVDPKADYICLIKKALPTHNCIHNITYPSSTYTLIINCI